ncbi:hypothetical protein [Tepidiforma sp.]|uniref:hypothetical protein n=1 Tax=Tepidiforma sp. TaxID=2682230 RepID=UPI002ADE15A6|nr:hypothetical protein [Tepidiforma sp.]
MSDRFGRVDLHREKVDNPPLGVVFEALNENARQHFTPPDVVQLTVDLTELADEVGMTQWGVVRAGCALRFGSGGMPVSGKEHITLGRRRNGGSVRPAINPEGAM